MAASTPASTTAPFGIRLGLIALLPLLAVAIYLDGQRFEPDLVELGADDAIERAAPATLPEKLGGLPRTGQVRRFGKDRLYEYINGHAEYFIGAGFRRLSVHEYGVSSDGQPAVVVNLYDMGEPLHAFGVLVDGAGDQESVDIGAMGFRSGQSLSFIQGPFYIQVNLFDEALSADSVATELAQSLAGEVEAPARTFRFPDLGKATATRFVKQDYRGLGFLNSVVERTFERNGEALQAFMIRAPREDVGELVVALETYFREDEMPYERIDRDGLKFFVIDDLYEGPWFFVPLEELLIGVYAPLDPLLATAMAAFAETLRTP